jgi:hypothetical protein
MRLRAAVLASLAFGLAAESAQASLTCDAARLDPRSYRLTTRAQALIVTDDDGRFRDAFALGEHAADLLDLNLATTRAAERALAIDPMNRMAHAILARQFLVLGEPEPAEQAWQTVLEAGGAVAWTGTLYDVDARTYFFLVFDQAGIRVYTFQQVAGAVERGFYGIPEFPGPENERFWAAVGGCIDPALRPEARIAWRDVSEIKAGNWVLWFKLAREVRITSDRTGKAKSLREIKVALHGRAGQLEVYKPVGEERLATRGRGPAGFQDMVRRTLVKVVDPDRRIQLPPLSPGVGW